MDWQAVAYSDQGFFLFTANKYMIHLYNQSKTVRKLREHMNVCDAETIQISKNAKIRKQII